MSDYLYGILLDNLYYWEEIYCFDIYYQQKKFRQAKQQEVNKDSWRIDKEPAYSHKNRFQSNYYEKLENLTSYSQLSYAG